MIRVYGKQFASSGNPTYACVMVRKRATVASSPATGASMVKAARTVRLPSGVYTILAVTGSNARAVRGSLLGTTVRPNISLQKLPSRLNSVDKFMQIEWELREDYAEIGGTSLLHEAVGEALAVLPREHLRQLSIIQVQDEDPRGKALGIWRQDHRGVGIDLYARPHVLPLLGLPGEVRRFALRLHLAYTLFHEVGHHVTRFLNKRTAPPRKAALVEQKIERWADDYAEKRLVKLAERWRKPGGLAETPEARLALELALKALRMDGITAQPPAETKRDTTGTNVAEAAS